VGDSLSPVGDAAAQVVRAPEEATNVQQLLTYVDDALSRALAVRARRGTPANMCVTQTSSVCVHAVA
jgi:hypothetical protein